MNSKFLCGTLAALAVSPALYAFMPLGAAGPQNVTWDAQNTLFNAPVWDNNFGGNWGSGAAPRGIDTAIFPASFTPIASDAFYGVRLDGSEVLLTNGGGSPPTAANLIFLNDWKLTQGTGGIIVFPGFIYPFSPLTLTYGDVTVGGRFTAIIDANIDLTGGLLTKLGAGQLRLEQMVMGDVLVEQGVLRGNFTVFGNLTNLATLSPGNSPGTITVAGNFRQSKGATLSIELESPTVFDQILVTGHAQMGGTLNVSLLDGFVPKRGEKFTFLQAGGGVSGEFNSVNAPEWDDLTLRPVYGKNTVTLKTVIDSFDALPGLTSNEYAVGRNLNTVLSDSRETNLVNYLYGKSFAQLPSYLDKISPSELTSIFTISTAYAQQQSLNLQRRTDDIRSGSNGFNAANLAINGDLPNYSGGFGINTGVAGPNGGTFGFDDGKEVKETKEVVAPAENRWGAFLSGTGEWVNVDGTSNARGYDLASGGFTLGVDYKVTPNFAIGLAAGYIGTTADLTDHGRIWTNGGKLGIYATFFQNPAPPQPAPSMSKDSSKEAPAPAPSTGGGFYVDTAAFGGFNSFDTRRNSLEGEARGDTDGGEVDAMFGTGYDFKMGGLTFGPTGTFNYTYMGMNGFTEHNSLAPLNIHSNDEDSLRTAFGFKLSYDCKCGSILIKPELRAAWQHEFGDTTYVLDSSFANGGGGTFTANGPNFGRDSALIGAGFAIQINDHVATYLYYDGEVGRRNYDSNAVTGGVRVAF